MNWVRNCWLKSKRNNETTELIRCCRVLATDLFMVTDNKRWTFGLCSYRQNLKHQTVLKSDWKAEFSELWTRFSFTNESWFWQWLWDDTWRLMSTCLQARVRYVQGCGSNSSCASGCRRWCSLSQTARQSRMSLFHRRRLCCQVTFIVTAPDSEIKTSNMGSGGGEGALVGKMLHNDSPKRMACLKLQWKH